MLYVTVISLQPQFTNKFPLNHWFLTFFLSCLP